MDEDVYLTIVDRKTDMILTAGYNVYPAEFERVLCMHPAVAQRPQTQLVAHCREHLAGYKVARAVQFVDEVLITASGKIMRRLLKTSTTGGSDTRPELAAQ